MPTVKMMDGTKFNLTDDQARQMSELLVQGKKWVVFGGMTINSSSVSGIYPDEVVRGEQLTGRLHDGTKVIKKFGEWRDAENPDVNLNAAFYPELAKDEVMTESTWRERIKLLN